MQSSFTAKALGDADELVKQRDELMAKVSNLQRDLAGFAEIKEQAYSSEVENRRLSCELISVKEENTRLHEQVTIANAERQRTVNMHLEASETFARVISQMAAGQGPAPKRARPSESSEEGGSVESCDPNTCREREESMEKYVQGLLKLRDAAHAKAVEELAAKHKAEVDKLRAKAAEPVNEFRVTKQFHVKEAELKSEVRKLQGLLEAEKARSKGMEFAQVERVDEIRTIKDLRLRCADRDRLAAEVLELKAEREKRNEPYRDMENRELLGIIDVLKEKHATVVIGMVDGVDAMKKERDDAVKSLRAAVDEAKMYKDCLEGKFGFGTAGETSSSSTSSSSKPSSSAGSKPKLCAPCGKLYTARLDTLKKKHADEVAKLQLSVKQWTAKFDARLEASAFSHRFRDRENELLLRLETTERDLAKARSEIREKRANFDTHMVSTLRHKAIAKELVAVKAELGYAKARVAELERSVMQDSVVADLAKKHQAQILRARRAHAQSRERAARLAADLDAEQLRARVGAMFEEDLLFAYRSLRAEYNRDVGRSPETKRPKRPRGVDEYGDGVSEGEPGM